MTYPNPNLAPKDGDYDMNDSSVESEKPYGISKGNQKPYKNGVEKIENAITESVMRKIKNLYGVKKN
jgi:transposase-like protein